MMDFGRFKVAVWTDGYPVWCHLSMGDQNLQFAHDEIQHLEAAVREMRRAVTAASQKQGMGRLLAEMGPRE